MFCNHSSLASFMSLTVKANVHSVTHGQLRNPQHTYVKRGVSKAHLKLNWPFKVIPGHPCWCRQKSRTVCCRNVQLMPTLFLKRTKIWQQETANSSISATPLRFDDAETPTNAFIARNCSRCLYFCHRCLLVFTQLSLKADPSESKTSGTKTEFEIATQGHSSLGHSFCNQSQADKGSISPYNIAGLMSEVSEVITEIAKHCSRRQPHMHAHYMTRN